MHVFRTLNSILVGYACFNLVFQFDCNLGVLLEEVCVRFEFDGKSMLVG